MSIPGSLKYLLNVTISLLLLLGAGKVNAQTPADTTARVDTAAVDSAALQPKVQAGRQLVLGVDIIRPIVNANSTDKYAYEFAADYYLKNETYLAAEGGFGSSKVDYSDLKYTTNNSFFRFGFNKYVFSRMEPKDWGGLFIGLRAAAANVQRSAATYTVIDSVWGNGTGSLPSKDFFCYWAELTAGVRVELIHGLFAGWNIRGKFMLNGKSFSDLSPLYIAGYGRGDKNAVFDFNFYLSYGIRWKRK